ncbi:TPA: hypothetical protein ACIVHF_000755 [Salmonella enterica subsp. enterica serovar Orientalis]|nr:hypothetical protein [Salmonella enterica subsp. enterica serovar Orientalis]
MWRRVNLALPHDATPVTCSQVAIHPWDAQHGYATPDGCYLNPVNAIKSLADRLSSAGNQGDIIILMVCATSATDFAQQLDALSAVLPLPSLEQTARRARTQITQATERMIIPATPLNGLPAPLPLIVSTLQNVTRNRATLDAVKAEGLASLNGLKSALSGFQAQRQQLQQQITAELVATGSKTAKVFAFVHTGDAVLARQEMMKNIPHPSASLTYAHLFTGDLSGMLNWITKV